MKKSNKQEELKKDLFKIKKILVKYLVNTSIDLQDTYITSPIGYIGIEKGKWFFDIDFSFIDDNNKIIFLMYIVRDLLKFKNFDFMVGHHTIWHPEDDMCCGVVFEEDIENYSKNLGVSKKRSLDILAGQLIDSYDLAQEEKQKQEEKNK